MRLELEPADLEEIAEEYEDLVNVLAPESDADTDDLLRAAKALTEVLKTFLEEVEDQTGINLLPDEEDDT